MYKAKAKLALGIIWFLLISIPLFIVAILSFLGWMDYGYTYSYNNSYGLNLYIYSVASLMLILSIGFMITSITMIIVSSIELSVDAKRKREEKLRAQINAYTAAQSVACPNCGAAIPVDQTSNVLTCPNCQTSYGNPYFQG